MPDLSFMLRLTAALLGSGLIAFLATPLVKSLAYKVGAIDVPKDNRRMHKEPIPRLGGLAIFIAFLFSTIVFGNIDRTTQGILLGAIMIVVLGVMDDITRYPNSWCRLRRPAWRSITAARSSSSPIPTSSAISPTWTWAGSRFR